MEAAPLRPAIFLVSADPRDFLNWHEELVASPSFNFLGALHADEALALPPQDAPDLWLIDYRGATRSPESTGATRSPDGVIQPQGNATLDTLITLTAVPCISIIDRGNHATAQHLLHLGVFDYLYADEVSSHALSRCWQHFHIHSTGTATIPIQKPAVSQYTETASKRADNTNTYPQARNALSTEEPNKNTPIVEPQQTGNYDQLTGLPNRSHFLAMLRTAIESCRNGGEPVALLIVGMDRFRLVNEELGQHAGDELLLHVADCLRACTGGTPSIARVGGDEFAIFIRAHEPRSYAREIAHSIATMIPQLLLARGLTVSTTCSGGIAIAPSDADNADMLFGCAESARTLAKRQRRSGFEFYSANHRAQNNTSFSLEDRLRRAFEHEEFCIYYQPQLELSHGQIVGAEALIRWHDPKRGVVLPGEFLPAMEHSGLILPVGEWGLRAACRQQLEWSKRGWQGLRIAYNLTAAQFARNTVYDTVARIIDDVGLEPSFLELEITEGFLIDDIDSCKANLESLKHLGVRIAVDDFGTGYSSLMHLRKFPIDVLKIDRSFVADVPHDPDARAIVAAMIALAHELQLEVVAEGIETQEQRRFLIEQGCKLGQGFLFSPAVPPAAHLPS